jgi:hypothetical protein
MQAASYIGNYEPIETAPSAGLFRRASKLKPAALPVFVAALEGGSLHSTRCQPGSGLP